MARIIAVGDKSQAIYAFRGADSKSMNRIETELKACILPLSVCYRCPKSVIKLAQNIVPDIEACDHAPEGNVYNIKDTEINGIAESGDFILCRCTAPLVSLCYEFLREGKRAYVKGRDIGQSLIAFMERLKADSFEDLTQKLNEYAATVIPALIEQNKEQEAILAQDKIDTLFILIEGCKDVDCVKAKIESLFSDTESNGICLSTVHKAKGLEAERVFILCPEKMPHPMAKTPEAQEQEKNIKYVAFTRVKFTESFEGALYISKTTKEKRSLVRSNAQELIQEKAQEVQFKD